MKSFSSTLSIKFFYEQTMFAKIINTSLTGVNFYPKGGQRDSSDVCGLRVKKVKKGWRVVLSLDSRFK